jgi:Xaa-Pro aminopeptidase
MRYFTGQAHVGWGVLVVPRGAPPILYAPDMERDEVTRAGLRHGLFDLPRYAREAGGDVRQAGVIGLEHVLRETNMTGRIQVSGLADVGETLDLFQRLGQRLPDLTVAAIDPAASPLQRSRSTKDDEEIGRIRAMGAVTVEIVGRVADFLTAHRVRRGLLVDRRDQVLTIGEVRRRIDLWSAQLGVENPEGTIFAIGRDAGVPHSHGQDDMPVPVGQAIIFDIYPCEKGGGYFYDFTRTWCLGHAPEAVEEAYRQVLAAYDLCRAEARAGADGRQIQRAVCEFFEQRGHPTVLSNPNTRDGYVHSVGHGVGLDVHETPWLTLRQEPPDHLEVGHVIALEPGLYYPERGFGVRVEDSLSISSDGAQILAPYPTDLVLPLRRSQRAPTKSSSRAKTTKPRATARPRRRA